MNSSGERGRAMVAGILFVGFALGVLWPGIGSGPADAQSTLYDAFNADDLDPERWFGEQFSTPFNAGLEATRLLQGNHLWMSHRVIGGTAVDTGQWSSRNRVRFFPFATASGITALEFTVAVHGFDLAACATAGSSPTRVAAGSNGWYFNDGTSTGPSDATGNVGAFVWLQRTSTSTDKPNVLRGVGGVYRVLGPSGLPTALLGMVDLGPAKKSVPATLRLLWDAAANEFVFQLNGGAVQTIGYTLSDIDPPSGGFKDLEVRGDVANCTAAPRPFGEITASFDDVFVNP
jgi:hypothetical protein